MAHVTVQCANSIVQSSRRAFLGLATSLVASAGGILVPMSVARASALPGVRQLHLYRPETREQLRIDYLVNGAWTPGAYTRLCWLLRDIHIGKSVTMDTKLIAVMDWTQHYLAQYGYTGPLHILSGFRSKKTNASTEGAAEKSQHLYGKAVDFCVPGLDPVYLGKLMNWLSQGGVGIYERKGFVHMDTGAIRLWHGARAPVPRSR